MKIFAYPTENNFICFYFTFFPTLFISYFTAKDESIQQNEKIVNPSPPFSGITTKGPISFATNSQRSANKESSKNEGALQCRHYFPRLLSFLNFPRKHNEGYSIFSPILSPSFSLLSLFRNFVIFRKK